jgi:hypothetical protein
VVDDPAQLSRSYSEALGSHAQCISEEDNQSTLRPGRPDAAWQQGYALLKGRDQVQASKIEVIHMLMSHRWKHLYVIQAINRTFCAHLAI